MEKLKELKFKCTECQEWHKREEWTEYKGLEYCADCAEEIFIDCEQCGGLVHQDDKIEAIESDLTEIYICQECFGGVFAECSNCDSFARNEDMAKDANSDNICPSCQQYYTHCGYCGVVQYDFSSDFNMIVCNDGEYICLVCLDEQARLKNIESVKLK